MMKFIFPITLNTCAFLYCCNKSLGIRGCLILFQARFPICSLLFLPLFVLNCLNFPFLETQAALKQEETSGIIKKDDSIYHFPGKCYFKTFTFLQNTLFDLSSFSPSKFLCLSPHLPLGQLRAVIRICIIILSLSPVSGSDLYFPHVLVFVKHFRIKLNSMTAVLCY